MYCLEFVGTKYVKEIELVGQNVFRSSCILGLFLISCLEFCVDIVGHRRDF